MISSVRFVPAGVADPNPKRYEISAAEQEIIDMMASEHPLDAQMMAEPKKPNKIKLPQVPNDHGLPAELRMDEYSSDEDNEMAIGDLLVGKQTMVDEGADEDEEESEDEDKQNDDDSGSESDDDNVDVPDTREYEPIDVEALESMGFSNIGASGGMADLYDEDDESEAEDVRLTEDDVLVLVAKTEDDFASLEVNVYDQRTGSLYVHHDIPLPAYPLAIAHGQVSANAVTGNFCAVGTFDPAIEIWNLDVLNALEPVCTLGGEDRSRADEILKMRLTSKGNKPEKISRGPSPAQLRPGSHTDAVMSLSWNGIHKQVIASGSADGTVKLWDVTLADNMSSGQCCASTFTHHRDKVQSVEWHPQEGTLLATGSYDRTVALIDARTNGMNAKTVKIPADCEAIAWDPFHPELLTVLSEDGTMSCWDVRKFDSSTPYWTFVASEFGGVTDLSYNRHVPGLLATCSADKCVALWDTHSQNNAPAENVAPHLCGRKDMCSGKLFTVSFYPSSAWILGSGGSGNQLALWDLSSEDALQKRFADRVDGVSSAPPSGDAVDASEKDFEAMMAQKMEVKSSPATTDKKKKKGKKNTHKKGR